MLQARDRLSRLPDSLRDLAQKSGCALHAYCLMTNHVHLLLTPAEPHACATLMRNLGQRYVQYFNRRYTCSGTLWEGRYRSCLVDSAEYVLACHRYIELNPVRAGMVASPSAYRWSSHNSNSGRIDNRLLSPHSELIALADDGASRSVAYQKLFDRGDQATFLRSIREATNSGFPLLGEKLKTEIAATGRRLTPRKPGPSPAKRVVAPDVLSGDFGL
jgi:putative transposase